MQKLALIELECLLEAWDFNVQPQLTSIQDEQFLTFETQHMTDDAWHALSCHSGICLAAELQDNALIPLLRHKAQYLPDDLPQILKYKGKTNSDFTFMLLHCAKAASAFAREQAPLCVLDPLCGKATTLFCALQEGDNAIGVELDAKAIAEADVYFERFLQFHRVKHKRVQGSQTLPRAASARTLTYTLASSAQSMKQGDTRSLCLIHGDTTRLQDLVRAQSAHLIVGDLPYGVQHAAKGEGGMSSLLKLSQAMLPACEKALKHGGAIALSFNTNTLRKEDLARLMREAGIEVLNRPPYHDFSHWVEQAVERDVLIGIKE
ncbi:MAG: hypothetical protein RSE58_03365 [Clostridia bacterium]